MTLETWHSFLNHPPPARRLFVPNIFLKSTRITLGTCAERMRSMIENHASFHFMSPAGTDLRENYIMAKGKMHLNRASKKIPHPPSPFLSPVKTPGFLPEISGFPFTPYCLNIIEPRFEPRTARASLRPSTFDQPPFPIPCSPFTIYHSQFTIPHSPFTRTFPTHPLL